MKLQKGGTDGIFAIVLSVITLLSVVIFIIVFWFKLDKLKCMVDDNLESIVEQINTINKIKYDVDVYQNKKISKL